MAEYSSMKVPELKKMLGERGLPQSGNKPDLIARLKEDDEKKEPAGAKTTDSKPAAESEPPFLS